MKIKTYLMFGLATGLLTLAIPDANAQERPFTPPDVLVLINDSNPDAVTFTATVNGPIADDTSHTFNQGVDFTNLLSGTGEFSSGLSGQGLTTGADAPGGPFYDIEHRDDAVTGGVYSDLDVYLDPDGSNEQDIETFKVGTRAFIGSATIDLHGYTLPAAGFTGEIYAGYSADESSDDSFAASLFADSAETIPGLTDIGEYEVIPEPSSYALLLGGLALLGLSIRRKLACDPLAL